MPSRLLKMKPSLPYNLENRLVNKWGFVIERRVHGEFILFKKNYISDAKDDGLKRTIRAAVDKPTTVETNIVSIDFKNQLSIYQKKQLERRCDNIVNHFPDPLSVPESVRARLTAIMQKMTMAEAQFVLEFMDENFPVVDKGE